MDRQTFPIFTGTIPRKEYEPLPSSSFYRKITEEDDGSSRLRLQRNAEKVEVFRNLKVFVLGQREDTACSSC